MRWGWIAAGFLAGVFLSGFWSGIRRFRQNRRLRSLTEYLERVNLGESGSLLESGEGEIFRLQDEIYKTVTALRQTRDAALETRKNYAENLSNIAHQLKTPITSLSLRLQLLKRPEDAADSAARLSHLEQMEQQLLRLERLEEALLLLARVDGSALTLERREVDVFTLLSLASDNLCDVLEQRRVSVSLPELGEVRILADLEWTMEAVMNLIKNCAEHAPEGSRIHMRYEGNPIYAGIRIWDEGPGFAKRDIPHLFERFYRGENAAAGGIGIGLSLAKELIALQNGTLLAENLPGGGACFTIRFYCH